MKVLNERDYSILWHATEPESSPPELIPQEGGAGSCAQFYPQA